MPFKQPHNSSSEASANCQITRKRSQRHFKGHIKRVVHDAVGQCRKYASSRIRPLNSLTAHMCFSGMPFSVRSTGSGYRCRTPSCLPSTFLNLLLSAFQFFSCFLQLRKLFQGHIIHQIRNTRSVSFRPLQCEFFHTFRSAGTDDAVKLIR